jgi:hypothetical protein
MREVFASWSWPRIRRTDLFEGETGTGKELRARHARGLLAAAGPFVAVDCGAQPESLWSRAVRPRARGSPAPDGPRGARSRARTANALPRRAGDHPRSPPGAAYPGALDASQAGGAEHRSAPWSAAWCGPRHDLQERVAQGLFPLGTLLAPVGGARRPAAAALRAAVTGADRRGDDAPPRAGGRPGRRPRTSSCW